MPRFYTYDKTPSTPEELKAHYEFADSLLDLGTLIMMDVPTAPLAALLDSLGVGTSSDADRWILAVAPVTPVA